MKLLHNVGYVPNNSNYNTPEQAAYAIRKGERISFDGVYRNVWLYRDILPFFLANEKPILFIMGGYTGENNKFDEGMPLEEYCDWNQLISLVSNYGCEMGWHTWSHRDLTTLTDREIIEEITPPFTMKYFAYPYGKFNARIIELVKEVGYEDAWSVDQGDDSRFQRKRSYL